MINKILIIYPDGKDKFYDYIHDWTPEQFSVFSDEQGEWYMDLVKRFDWDYYEVLVKPLIICEEDENK